MTLPEEAQTRHAALVRELEANAYRYYVLDDPTVTDAEYDQSLRALRALEAAYPALITPTSPSQRVAGEARAVATKVKHEVRMFSLDNAYGREDLAEFVERVEGGLATGAVPTYAVEPKLDGASVEVVYEHGALAQASTRGDGETGEDITTNLRTLRGVPLTIPHQGKITLRGEVIIYRKDLETFNAERVSEGLEPFANPRNAAAGAVRMLDPREVARRPLRALFYQLVEGAKLHTTHAESLRWLGTLGIPTHRREVTCASLDEVVSAIAAIDGARASYPFETDGAVVKVDAYRQQEVLGFTSKFPKWAIAYKFAAEQARTVVRAIVVQVGRTGALTPVAVLDPVELAGTTVSRASLHNLGMIATLDVRPLDTVVIQKAGEIIPQVIDVDASTRQEGATPFVMPTHCPVCAAPIAVTGEAIVRCTNRQCPAQIKAQIFYFARRFAMDIDHLGVALVEQLVDRGIVRDVADLYTLTTEQVAALERMAAKSAKNVVESIAGSRDRTLDRLICGLGISQVGQVAARQLAEEAGTLEALVGWSEDEAREHVGGIHGFGPKMVDSVIAYLKDPVAVALVQKLSALGVGRPQPRAAVATEGALVGLAFCVTGVLSRKREDIHDDLRAAGATVHDTVKKTTTYLVAGDKTGKTKLDQAKKFGVRVVNEGELDALLRGEALAPLP